MSSHTPHQNKQIKLNVAYKKEEKNKQLPKQPRQMELNKKQV